MREDLQSRFSAFNPSSRLQFDLVCFSIFGWKQTVFAIFGPLCANFKPNLFGNLPFTFSFFIFFLFL